MQSIRWPDVSCPIPSSFPATSAGRSRRFYGLLASLKLAALAAFATLLAISTVSAPARAQDDGQSLVYRIGYVHLDNDPRLGGPRTFMEIPVAPLGAALRGAEVALIDSELMGRQLGIDFQLQVARNDNLNALALIIEGWVAEGINFVVADLPAAQLASLAGALESLPVTFFNVSADDDELRGAGCRANLIHAVPSQSMMTDAVTQFLSDRRWRDVLLLRGPAEADRALADAFERSAIRAGLRVVEVRDYVLSVDTSISALTAGEDYDVVFVADAFGAFANLVPYETREARPVVGAAGLVPLGWHWSWSRAGASGLNARFEFHADRRMGTTDWAAWISVSAIVQAVFRARTESGEGGDAPITHEALLSNLLSQDADFDGAKGTPLTVRPWDQQLRQPVLLATHNRVVARAPLDGFVHPANDLDTLGIGAERSECRL